MISEIVCLPGYGPVEEGGDGGGGGGVHGCWNSVPTADNQELWISVSQFSHAVGEIIALHVPHNLLLRILLFFLISFF